MPQGILPYKYEQERTASGMTSLGGLPVYLDLACVLGLGESIASHVRVKVQGYTDEQMIRSLVLLNLAGGDAVDDLAIIEKDEGFCKVLQRVELKGLARQQRRAQERHWKKEKRRTVPSPSAVFRFLSHFHDPFQEGLREKGKAFIPSVP